MKQENETDDCGRCGDVMGARITVNHVSYQSELYSTMEREMTVCVSCYDDMENDDRWRWPGKGQ